ncbi:hypothetical protein CSC70_12970 [Pseudoxanthomonas kalamensis DSM 18571]|uniref:Csu type fimbrial protein n=1 Tax=Pseudoxanthomonas kalamensis TaxID=289483 RepID=UPI001391991B|nr:spore coat U domain-containing protein [Pseudoxanthomonas kalamensis]KAF1708551.1 hypothetical protein CSC70_12970 [Pseudoxanthomonas kalamensis DSM 18571]
MNVFKTSLIATALIAAGVAGSAHAATDTATFQVQIVITESCDISTVAPTDIDFGTHTRSTGAPADATGTITVNCSNGTPYQIGLDNGQNALATQRRMANGGIFVPYNLYSDNGRTVLWGNTLNTDTVSGTGTAADQAYTVYGRVPSTNYPTGTYLDTVTATVIY